MKPQELRVGNTIMCQCRGEYKPHTIKSIWYNDEEKLYYVELYNGFQCNINGITPIPITEELLEKNGFKPYTKEYNAYTLDLDIERRVWMFKNTYGWTLQYVRYGVGYNDEVSKNIVMFVHQLQNAYYLATGKELEIKL